MFVISNGSSVTDLDSLVRLFSFLFSLYSRVLIVSFFCLYCIILVERNIFVLLIALHLRRLYYSQLLSSLGTISQLYYNKRCNINTGSRLFRSHRCLEVVSSVLSILKLNRQVRTATNGSNGGEDVHEHIPNGKMQEKFEGRYGEVVHNR